VLGELLVGLLLGPSLIDLTHLSFITNTHLGETVSELGELGVMLLMFLAGLELEFKDLARNMKVSALSGSLGVILPVGLGLLTGELLGMDFSHAMFLGLTLGATSVSISAQTLMELKVLRSPVGLGLLGAAVFDDILVILLLSASVAVLSGGGSFWQILWVFVRMILFLVLAAGIGLWLLPRMVRLTSKLSVSQGLTTFTIVILLLYGLAAELVGGMAAITGTFMAGLMFSRTPEKSAIESNLVSLSYAFFVPIFFVSIGLNVNLRQLGWDSLWIFAVISVIAILGKIIGAGSGALLAKFNLRESVQLGIGMVSRGEVGLIIANIGVRSGYLSEEVLTVIVGMILVTTLVTPPMLRAAFKKSDQKKPEMESTLEKTKEESV
jgi:Kef-type K+ transport system membrane component KefB